MGVASGPAGRGFNHQTRDWFRLAATRLRSRQLKAAYQFGSFGLNTALLIVLPIRIRAISSK
jgi:hypothetical protein